MCDVCFCLRVCDVRVWLHVCVCVCASGGKAAAAAERFRALRGRLQQEQQEEEEQQRLRLLRADSSEEAEGPGPAGARSRLLQEAVQALAQVEEEDTYLGAQPAALLPLLLLRGLSSLRLEDPLLTRAAGWHEVTPGGHAGGHAV